MKMDISFHGAIAGMVVALATIAGLELAVLNVEAPYLVMLPAVIIAFIIGGAVTAALSISLAAISTWFFFIPPIWSFALPSYEHGITYLLFLAVLVLVWRILAVQRRTIDELASTNINLRSKLVKAGVRDAVV